MTRFGLLLLAFAVLAAPARSQSSGTEAQTGDTTATKNDAGWLLLPSASYAPETKFSGGMALGYYQSEQAGQPGSSVQASITVTQKRQLIAQATPELYLTGGDWRIQGDLQVAHYPDSFYGIGGNTSLAAEEGYTARYVLIDATVQRRLQPQLHVGPRLYTRAGTVTEPDSGGLIARGRVPGTEGGLTAGLGGGLLWDARDSRYYPTTGAYAEVVTLLHSAAWGSDYTFGRVKMDFRGYHPFGPGLIAGQVYTDAIIGQAPFSVLPLLGGSNQMRGYRTGRLRDDMYWTVQAEYRVPLFWRFKGTAFASVGEVGPRIGSPLVNGVETAIGVGGRLRLTENGVHGRVDVAYSRTGIELYLSLGEAF